MLHYYDLDISEVSIHDNYLINQIREVEHETPAHTEVLKNILQTYFSNKKVIYISNRVNSYSVDPLTYGFVGAFEKSSGHGHSGIHR